MNDLRSLSVGTVLSLFFLVSVSTTSHAKPLYRYVDKNGRLVVSDKPPTEGKFEVFEPETNVNIIKAPNSAPSLREDSGSKRASQREAIRARLIDELNAARAQLEDARKLLAENGEPKEGELRPIQGQPDNGGKPNAKGQVTAAGGRVICPIDPYGKPVCVIGSAPNEEYYARIERLEEQLKRAQNAVDEAERRYRRDAPD